MEAASRLFDFIRNASLARAMADARNARSSKNRPSADEDTGPEAAGKYLLRKRLVGGSGNSSRSSNIRKIQRADRIERGLRPLRYDVAGKRERAIARKQALLLKADGAPQ